MDVKELYAGVSKEKRRAALAHSLAQEVTTVPQGRLMNIINDAMRWCAARDRLHWARRFATIVDFWACA